MITSTRLKLLFPLWALAELFAFVAVVKFIGLPEALLVGLMTSLLGWTLLRRAGASAMVKFRAILGGRMVPPDSRRFLDDSLATIGALALLLPGFLSDAAGLVLAVPAARDRLSLWIGTRPPGGRQPDGRRHAPTPSTIDLDPQDWRRTEAERTPAPKT